MLETHVFSVLVKLASVERCSIVRFQDIRGTERRQHFAEYRNNSVRGCGSDKFENKETRVIIDDH